MINAVRRTYLERNDLYAAGLDAAADASTRLELELSMRPYAPKHVSIVGDMCDHSLRLLRAGISANPLDRVQVGSITPDDTVEIDLSTAEGTQVFRVTGRQILDFVMGAQEVRT